MRNVAHVIDWSRPLLDEVYTIQNIAGDFGFLTFSHVFAFPVLSGVSFREMAEWPGDQLSGFAITFAETTVAQRRLRLLLAPARASSAYPPVIP